MRDEEDGGQVFPLPINQYGEIPRLNKGMTLRDWFAGQALVHQAKPSLHEYELVALFGKDRTGITREEILAADAYRIADAMLAERSK